MAGEVADPPRDELSIAASVLRIRARAFRQQAAHPNRTSADRDIHEAEKLERVAAWIDAAERTTLRARVAELEAAMRKIATGRDRDGLRVDFYQDIAREALGEAGERT